MRTKHLIRALLPVLICVAAAGRGVTPEDYYSFKNVTDARISPDGKSIAYVITSVDQKRNRRNSDIWLMETGGAGPGRQLTTGPSSRMPRWSPDGRSIAFISVRPATAGDLGHSDKPQIFLLSMTGGEAHRLTDLLNGVDSYQWSPQGDRLVCVSKTGPVRKPVDQGGSDVKHYTSIAYKFNDTGFYDERRGHLFIVDAKSGKANQITSGDARNDIDPQWSPDGTKLAFATEDTNKPALENNDIWVVPAAGGNLTRINEATGSVNNPRWSPDGSRIAYTGAPSAEELPKIWLASAAGGEQARRRIAQARPGALATGLGGRARALFCRPEQG